MIDNGSSTTRVGFGGEEIPKCVFPTVVGKPRNPRVVASMGVKPYYFGTDARNKRGVLIQKYPLEYGRIINWDDMEKLWNHTLLEDLKVSPNEHPVILTESPLNPKANREKMVQIMFETFNVPSLFLGSQPVLSLYSTGKTIGTVLDIGDTVCNIVPVCEGYACTDGISTLNIGGRDLTEYLMELLNALGYAFTTVEREIVRDMKEKLGYIAIDYHKELHNLQTSTLDKLSEYELPDGQIISLCNEKYQCPEILFQPSLMNNESSGIHELTYNSIMKCNSDIRNELFNNIVLSGGSTMFPGFEERFKKELITLSSNDINIDITSAPSRPHSAWIGASKLCNEPNILDRFISFEDYDEYGPSIIHQICPLTAPSRVKSARSVI